ncbi:hypothetical protein E2C01_035746 [Portunus trituberculatus]|uniref:Uncharacterized protein n=1 Tax=Portunus trituberculatus TaxID=210409 RepID=A0A5B7F6R4_PORTR|nr:hypothetical protein [Portunus trituberculatus]
MQAGAALNDEQLTVWFVYGSGEHEALLSILSVGLLFIGIAKRLQTSAPQTQPSSDIGSRVPPVPRSFNRCSCESMQVSPRQQRLGLTRQTGCQPYQAPQASKISRKTWRK